MNLKVKKPVFFFGLLLAGIYVINAQQQEIAVYKYEQLQPYLEKNNDTTYLINFWATWCKPCVEEMPYIEKINTEYSNQAFKALLVSLDWPTNVESRVLQFIKEKNINAQVVLLDDTRQNYWINAVDSSWTGSIPATLVYGPSGRSFHEKPMDYHELKSIIQKHIEP